MNRKQFFTLLGASSGIFFIAPVLSSCSSKSTGMDTNPGPTPPSGVDFTLDLTSASNASLTSNGGSLLKNGIIIARTSSGSFVAVASACTHQGTTIEFDSANNRFHCPNHGSNFSTSGSVLLGPATVALKQYTATLTGTNLRITG